MEFRYFRAPRECMSDRIDGEMICSICGAVGNCFRIEYLPNQPEVDTRGAVGCYDCLRFGRFEFTHYTEAGFLDHEGLLSWEAPEEKVIAVDPTGNVVEVSVIPAHDVAPPGFSAETLTELRRTPGFRTLQGGATWLCHCDDFMAYLGEWEPSDFHRHAPDGNGQALFEAMTDDEWQRELWLPGESPSGWERFDVPPYYAFRCLHCDILRGWWDTT
jgi:hypothetical protein